MGDKQQSQSTEVMPLPKRALGIMDTLGIKLSDPSELTWDIAERLALADSAEALFGDSGPVGWRTQLGRPVLVQRVRWFQGNYEEGAGFYALVDAADATTGERLLLTSGATSVLIQLAKADAMGWLDKPVTARESDRATANGYKPYKLWFT